MHSRDEAEKRRLVRPLEDRRIHTIVGPTVPARNVPCPCGSGRKFKQCHGAPPAYEAKAETPNVDR